MVILFIHFIIMFRNVNLKTSIEEDMFLLKLGPHVYNYSLQIRCVLK